jgi:hypothetical protein
VGVLPFRVKKGTRQASYLAAPLVSSLPGRVENVLIMSQGSNESRAVGVIRDAAGTASQAKVGSYIRSPASFTKLFRTSYTLGWGNKKVKADAFLTGFVSNTGDRSKTTVQLQLITPKSRESGKVRVTNVGDPIEVKTDRSLLSDLGYTYALSRSATGRRVSEARRNLLAVRQVAQQEDGKKQPQAGQKDALTPDNISGFAFELRYDGVKQTLRRLAQSKQGAKSAQYSVDPVAEGTNVTMVLTRLDEEDTLLGVVLRVNGESTWDFEKEEPIACKKWIYDVKRKGQEDVFRGVYTDVEGKNLTPWRVLSPEESRDRASAYGDKAGWITIDVFASGPDNDTADEQELKISSRGLARSKKKFKTLQDLQASLRKANNVKLKKRLVDRRGPGGLLVAESEAAEGGLIDSSQFPNPIHLGSMAIRYYDPKAGDDEPEDLLPQ